jgi:hypothetical protein
MQGAPGVGPNTEQHFGNAETTNGGLLFQGIVHGDLTINRKHRLHTVLIIEPAFPALLMYSNSWYRALYRARQFASSGL